MLNSRYIHLHQALGLGSMWLNQHAQIRPTQGSLKAEGFNEVKTSATSFGEARTEYADQTKPSATSFDQAQTNEPQTTPTTSPHPSTHLPHGNALAKIRQRSNPSQTTPATQPNPSAQPQPLLQPHAPPNS